MSLLPLADLVVQKPRPETTLALIPAYWDHGREMVESYIFTDTIRQYFTQILESVATGAGQGFWVQAEYGAGKTHFLTTLAALIANGQEGSGRQSTTRRFATIAGAWRGCACFR